MGIKSILDDRTEMQNHPNIYPFMLLLVMLESKNIVVIQNHIILNYSMQKYFIARCLSCGMHVH